MAQPLLLARCPAAAAAAVAVRTSSRPTLSLLSSIRCLHHQQSVRDKDLAHRRYAHRCSPRVRSSASLAPPRPTQTRSYHSQYHPPPPPHDYTTSQVSILSAALRHVPEHGFTHRALVLGARDAGFLDVSLQLLPRGEMDLVLFWLASRRGLLKGLVEGGLFEKKQQQQQQQQHAATKEFSVEEKVKILVLERLRMNEEIVHRWQDALSLMSLLENIPAALAELHALASDILTLAGDASVDTAWYTKRLSLSAVYATAEAVMTQDRSAGFADTEAFVDRRIEDATAVGEKLGGVRQYLGFMAGTAVGLGRSWGLKI
ncbi:hypothetical protein VTN02DRAFT_3804 [Thermoascus thermophilus]